MAEVIGRTVPLSLPQRLMADLTCLAQSMPMASFERRLAIPEVTKARSHASGKVSWCALMTKAFALVAQEHSGLRQVYRQLSPRKRYEHPHSVATVFLDHPFGTLMTSIRGPELQSLAILDRHLQRQGGIPIAASGRVRRLLKQSCLPWWARRGLWWSRLYSNGSRRARHFGTFSISAEANRTWAPPSGGLATCDLRYQLVSESEMKVAISFDQRILTATVVEAAIMDMAQVLREEIVQELQDLSGMKP